MPLDAALRAAAVPFAHEDDVAPLVAFVGQRPELRFVLLGEASHGTHEFYRLRAEITKRLVLEHGFHAVAIEADWPDAYRVHRFVVGTSDDAAVDALDGFRRFPSWIWRNTDVLDFVSWLGVHNERAPHAARVGFYGLDLYSSYASIEAVLGYLDRVDPDAAHRARIRFSCFDRFDEDSGEFGYTTAWGLEKPCEDEAVAELVALRERAFVAAKAGADDDARTYVEQNARLGANAAEYYRKMFAGRVSSWNLRDRHMTDALETLCAFLGRRTKTPKIVVWAHNAHVGDARATDFADSGEWNLGQLVRERYPRASLLVGFTTYEGTVTAARHWGGPAERRIVRSALRGSWEAMLRESDLGRFVLFPEPAQSGEARLERAMGVVYRPETERRSHYFSARLAAQFDAVIHLDRTRAVEPLERSAEWLGGEGPESHLLSV
jgi:erythromycin esterase-like protein